MIHPMYIESQGDLVTATKPSLAPRKPPTRRAGDIAAFSKASRIRLIKLFARLKTKHQTRKVFLTLTFASIPTPEEAKAALKRFLERIRHHLPKVTGVWRMELQDRGSIHFHLILFGLPFIPQKRLQEVWTECTGEERSIAHITRIRTMKGVKSYVSKYLAKSDQAKPDASLDCPPYPQTQDEQNYGRWWGYHNKPLLPFDIRLRVVVPDDDLQGYWRAALKIMSKGKAGVWSASGFCFRKDAHELVEWIASHGGFYASEWENFINLGLWPGRADAFIPQADFSEPPISSL